ncbi:MAG: hypothetical protein KJ646_05835 [Nanoarchaeota archaeon]|nr:hypothetical protein [Nanoarchaeota archaeon]MBU4116387.1 hypothetical protein [Nanoarchaeota archaeon]
MDELKNSQEDRSILKKYVQINKRLLSIGPEGLKQFPDECRDYLEMQNLLVKGKYLFFIGPEGLKQFPDECQDYLRLQSKFKEKCLLDNI